MEILEFNFTAVVMLLQFILLAFFLYKFLYAPFLRMTAQRRKKVTEELENAERIRQQAHETEIQIQQKLKEISEHADQMMETARKRAREFEQEEKEKVRLQVQRSLESAQKEIEYMAKEAREELTREVAGLSILIASKVLERNLDEKAQMEYISKMLARQKEREEN